MASQYFQSTQHEEFQWYLHHISPSWCLCKPIVQEIENTGMIISIDNLKEKSNCRKNNSKLDFPEEGSVIIKNPENGKSMWTDYISAEFIKENTLSIRKKNLIRDHYNLWGLENFKFNFFEPDDDQFFFRSSLAEILEDRHFGSVIISYDIEDILNLKDSDFILVRLDQIQKGNLEIIQNLKNLCVWL